MLSIVCCIVKDVYLDIYIYREKTNDMCLKYMHLCTLYIYTYIYIYVCVFINIYLFFVHLFFHTCEGGERKPAAARPSEETI